MDQHHTGPKCSCPHHSMVPLLIVLIGVALLLQNLAVLTPYAVGVIWPILLIIIGLIKMFSGRCACCVRP